MLGSSTGQIADQLDMKSSKRCYILFGLFVFLQFGCAICGERVEEDQALILQVKVENLIEKVLHVIQDYYHQMKTEVKCIPEKFSETIMNIIKTSVECVDNNEKQYDSGYITARAHKRAFLKCFSDAKKEVEKTMVSIEPTVNHCPPNVTEKTYQINVTTTFTKTFRINIKNGLDIIQKQIPMGNQEKICIFNPANKVSDNNKNENHYLVKNDEKIPEPKNASDEANDENSKHDGTSHHSVSSDSSNESADNDYYDHDYHFSNENQFKDSINDYEDEGDDLDDPQNLNPPHGSDNNRDENDSVAEDTTEQEDNDEEEKETDESIESSHAKSHYGKHHGRKHRGRKHRGRKHHGGKHHHSNDHHSKGTESKPHHETHHHEKKHHGKGHSPKEHVKPHGNNHKSKEHHNSGSWENNGENTNEDDENYNNTSTEINTETDHSHDDSANSHHDDGNNLKVFQSKSAPPEKNEDDDREFYDENESIADEDEGDNDDKNSNVEPNGNDHNGLNSHSKNSESDTDDADKNDNDLAGENDEDSSNKETNQTDSEKPGNREKTKDENNNLEVTTDEENHTAEFDGEEISFSESSQKRSQITTKPNDRPITELSTPGPFEWTSYPSTDYESDNRKESPKMRSENKNKEEDAAGNEEKNINQRLKGKSKIHSKRRNQHTHNIRPKILGEEMKKFTKNSMPQVDSQQHPISAEYMTDSY